MKILNRIIYGKTTTPKYIRQKRLWLYNDQWYNTNDFVVEYTKPYCSLNNAHIYSYNDNGVVYHAANFDDLIEHVINNPNITVNNLQNYSSYEVNVLKTLKQYNLLKTFKDLEKAKEKIIKSAEEINELFK